MKSWEKALIGPSATVETAIRTLDATGLQICLVVDGDRRLLGTVTDGDIRRGLLRALKLDTPVTAIMNAHPLTGTPAMSRQALIDLMTDRVIHKVPLLDAEGRVVNIADLGDLVRRPAGRNWVVVLAGGLGSRLRPLTDDTPKPLLEIGGRPLLETILETLAAQGFKRVYISVNYKAEQVIAHFGDGARWGVEIRYLHETMPLGTGGPLGLIEERPGEPLIAMNGDLLTNVNLNHMLDYHREHAAAATMAVRECGFEIPYGVVVQENSRLVSIEEKPVQTFLVNAGIYVLQPDVLDLIPPRQRFDMPELFRRLAAADRTTAIFPICEYWLDIGRLDDLKKANDEFPAHFAGEAAGRKKRARRG